ncbi:hypothetical protein GCM10023354_15730 [Garicola koreensis]
MALMSPSAILRTTGQILDDFPEREAEDIKQALRFAAATLNERQVPLLPA